MTHQELFAPEEAGMVRVSQGTWQPTGSRQTHWSSSTSPSTQITSHFYLWASPVKWVWTASSQDLLGWMGILTSEAVPQHAGTNS